jgi:hypothetical protein
MAFDPAVSEIEQVLLDFGPESGPSTNYKIISGTRQFHILFYRRHGRDAFTPLHMFLFFRFV